MTFIDALGAAKGAYDLVSVAIKARDEAKIQAAMGDLREKLWEMSNNGLSQMQTLHSLELENQKMRMELVEARRTHEHLESKVKEKTQYQFFEIVPGAWAYTSAESIDLPVHKRPNFCASCHSSGKVVPLQYLPQETHGQETWFCPGNSAHTLVNERVEYDPANGEVVLRGY